MAELMLALGRDDTRALLDIDTDLLSVIHGVKILDNETYNIEGEKVVQAAISRLARSRGVINIFDDTKFAIDTPFEMVDGVDKASNSYLQTSPNNLSGKLTKIPEFMSTVVDLPEIALGAFSARTAKLGIIPVCHVTPSRYTEKDYRNRQSTREKNAIWKINLFTEAQHTIGAVVCSAVDAKIIRFLRPDLFIFATGAYLDEPQSDRHPGGAPISKTAQFADVLIIGAPILRDIDPSKQLERRLNI